MDIQTDGHTDRWTYRQMDIQTDGHTNRWTYRQKDVHSDGHTDMDIQIDGLTDR
jgi:hypothetical protein